mgnify:CR=1 FL=1
MNRMLKTLAALAVGTMVALGAGAQAPEKKKITIAVGGKNLFYYLPLSVAERKGYFKDEGLEVEIPDFAGGAKALQALVGGSADLAPSTRTLIDGAESVGPGSYGGPQNSP